MGRSDSMSLSKLVAVELVRVNGSEKYLGNRTSNWPIVGILRKEGIKGCLLG